MNEYGWRDGGCSRRSWLRAKCWTTSWSSGTSRTSIRQTPRVRMNRKFVLSREVTFKSTRPSSCYYQYNCKHFTTFLFLYKYYFFLLGLTSFMFGTNLSIDSLTIFLFPRPHFERSRCLWSFISPSAQNTQHRELHVRHLWVVVSHMQGTGSTSSILR